MSHIEDSNSNPAPKFASVYNIELCFGGHEEGGWWYTRRTHIFALGIPKGSTDAEIEIIEAKAKEHAREAHGSVFKGDMVNTAGFDRPANGYRSTRPEEDSVLIFEDKVGEHETTETPRYE